MEFNPGAFGKLPFYMTRGNAYPGIGYPWGQEQGSVQDLEYLQATYPVQVRKIQRKIGEILDKMDSEGSMIYDEYPDKFGIMRLADTIGQMLDEEDVDERLIQVLLCDEIYKRRHGGRRGFVMW